MIFFSQYLKKNQRGTKSKFAAIEMWMRPGLHLCYAFTSNSASLSDLLGPSYVMKRREGLCVRSEEP